MEDGRWRLNGARRRQSVGTAYSVLLEFTLQRVRRPHKLKLELQSGRHPASQFVRAKPVPAPAAQK